MTEEQEIAIRARTRVEVIESAAFYGNHGMLSAEDPVERGIIVDELRRIIDAIRAMPVNP